MSALSPDADGGNGEALALVAKCEAVPLLTLTKPPARVAKRSAELPVTGSNVASMVTLGAGLIVGGFLLLLLRRRWARHPVPVTRDEVDDIRRAVVVTWRD